MTGENDFAPPGKTFRQPRNNLTRDEFRGRVSDSLRKRLAPNTALRKIDLARALTVDVKTVDNWLARYSQPDGFVLTQLIHFFDGGFANEVFGSGRFVVAKLDDMRRFLAVAEVSAQAAKAFGAIAELTKAEIAA